MFPEWRGNLLIGGLRATALVRLELDGSKVTHEERMLRELGQRIRDVVQGPGGAVYVITDEDNGAILKISRAQ
jgi:glucose/arabinose dehydrogenase